jgi:hypothetical protein
MASLGGRGILFVGTLAAVAAACTSFGSSSGEPDAASPLAPDASPLAPDAAFGEPDRDAARVDARGIDATDAGAVAVAEADASCRDRDAGYANPNCGDGGAREVACGSQVCRDGTPACCRGDGSTANCKASCGSDSVFLECDSPNDCAEGQVCCGYAMSSGIRAVCAKSCGPLPSIALCTDSSQCRNGSCTTTYSTTGYRYCTL